MTVCIAAIFRWVYDDQNNDIGPGIITASDRMLSAADLGIEYEPWQFKGASFGNKIVVLVAGDIVVHSKVIRDTEKHLAASPEHDVEKVAEIFASYLRQYRARRAAHECLSPIGLDENALQQGQIAPELAIELTNQMQGYKFDAEALIVGTDLDGMHIFYVDRNGLVTRHDALSFSSIGGGGVHATAEFMRLNYTKNWRYHDAVYLAYSAKRRAEIAPGVGLQTDMAFINRDGIYPLMQGQIAALKKIYERQLKKKAVIDQQGVRAFLKTEVARLAATAAAETAALTDRTDDAESEAEVQPPNPATSSKVQT